MLGFAAEAFEDGMPDAQGAFGRKCHDARRAHLLQFIALEPRLRCRHGESRWQEVAAQDVDTGNCRDDFESCLDVDCVRVTTWNPRPRAESTVLHSARAT
jgi:hypothetical protein